MNEVGNFSCQCESAGFQRATDLADCLDIDECTINKDPCPGPYDVCVNTAGSFNCSCVSTGYERTHETAGMLTLMKFDPNYEIRFCHKLRTSTSKAISPSQCEFSKTSFFFNEFFDFPVAL